VKNTLQVHLRESELPEHKVVKLNALKVGFYGRKDYPKNANGLKQAIATRPVLMKAVIAVHLKMIECRGINIFKQVELAMKWKTIHTSSIQGR